MDDFLSDERFVKEHLKTFVMFMGHDGYLEVMVTEEFPRRQTVKLDACPIAYCRLQRTGSRFARLWCRIQMWAALPPDIGLR